MADVLRTPSSEDLNHSNMAKYMAWLKENGLGEYPEYPALHQWSVTETASFWQSIWDYTGVKASVEPQQPVFKAGASIQDRPWFPEAKFNFAENLLRFAQKGDPDRTAITFISEVSGTQSLSWSELYGQVKAFAFFLKKHKVQPGDRVAAYIGNTPEALIAMLATTSLGAVWSSASPDFGTAGVVDRFGQVEPKVLLAANGYKYGGKIFERTEAIYEIRKAIQSIEATVVVPSLPGGEVPEGALMWDRALASGDQFAQGSELAFFQGDFDHPIYILFSSGTTGKPKCIVHGAGGTLLQHSKELLLHGNIREDSVFLYFTTTGWMMWNWLASGLVTGARLVLFDGNPGYPDMMALWRVIAEEQVTHFGTSAKFISSSRMQGVEPGQLDLSKLDTIFSTGSPLMPEDYDWIFHHVGDQLHLASISGGTDIVSCFVGGNPMLPVVKGRIQCKGLGMDVKAFNDAGEEVINERGELVCTTPAPSMPIGFWRDEEGQRYRSAYFERFENVWAHGDFVEFDEQGSCIIYGRSDSTLNPGGVRIGTAEVYRQVEKVSEVADSIVVGQPWQDDVRVVLLVKMAADQTLNDDIQRTIRQTLKLNASPRHVPALIVAVPDIPYTRSGKKVELAALKAIQGEEIDNLGAIANPESLDAIANMDWHQS